LNQIKSTGLQAYLMNCKTYFFIDAGIEKLHIRHVGIDSRQPSDRIHLHRGQLQQYLTEEKNILRETAEKIGVNPEIYLTGKLAAQAQGFLEYGTRLHPEAVLWQAARCLTTNPEDCLPPAESIAIIDFSASGFCIAAARSRKIEHRRR
jgi:hypothetical protein